MAMFRGVGSYFGLTIITTQLRALGTKNGTKNGAGAFPARGADPSLPESVDMDVTVEV